MSIKQIKILACQSHVMASAWILIGILSAVFKINKHNNFDIFRYVFFNTIEHRNLYAPSFDGSYWDINHYGPFFSLHIAPFTVGPVWLSHILWCTSLAGFFFYTVREYVGCSTVKGYGRKVFPFIIWFCAHELLTALFMQQFNVAIAGIIIMSYVFVEKGREQYSTLFIVIGTFVKLYGIVGLAFFFSKNKKKFVLWLAIWSIVLFCLPMLISSPEYQLDMYREWYVNLTEKNHGNEMSIGTNISLHGLLRKIGYTCAVGFSAGIAAIRDNSLIDKSNWWIASFSDAWVIITGLLVTATGYFRIRQWKNEFFRMTILADVLMFVCLFSTGTESSGYIHGREVSLTKCLWSLPSSLHPFPLLIRSQVSCVKNLYSHLH